MTAPINRILVGDAATALAAIEPNSIDMVLGSPPYFRLRNYQIDGQIGIETAVDHWVDKLVDVARAARSVLVPTGTLWLNLGDSFSVNPSEGAARKSLLLGPERLALRLTDEGWLLRNKIIWRKTNPMPSSVRDRLGCTWEYLFIFAKAPAYYFVLDAIRVPHVTAISERSDARGPDHQREAWRGPNSAGTGGLSELKAKGMVGHPLDKNPGDVWQLASSNYRAGDSEQLDAARRYGIATSGSRPDIVIEVEREGASRAVLLELKATKSAEYLGTGLMQLLGYLRDRPTLFGREAAAWLVAPTGAPMSSTSADGRELWVVGADGVGDAAAAGCCDDTTDLLHS